jgi:hypothetical protein
VRKSRILGNGLTTAPILFDMVDGGVIKFLDRLLA